jgi:hypothetical protein
MHWYLREIGAPEYPLPTRSVCDALDVVRKDTASLLSMQNSIQRKGKELSQLKAQQKSQETQIHIKSKQLAEIEHPEDAKVRTCPHLCCIGIGIERKKRAYDNNFAAYYSIYNQQTSLQLILLSICLNYTGYSREASQVHGVARLPTPRDHHSNVHAYIFRH